MSDNTPETQTPLQPLGPQINSPGAECRSDTIESRDCQDRPDTASGHPNQEIKAQLIFRMSKPSVQKASIALALAALNLAIGGIVSWFKLPIYLDTIGLIVSTVLLGWRFGLLTGAVTVGAGFMIINPYYLAYVATMLSLVTATELLAARRMFGSIGRSAASGVILAMVAATTAAPVTAYLFGGVTASGADLLTALLRQTGKTILESVVLSGISSELVDKELVSLGACLVFRALPRRFLMEFSLRSQRPSDTGAEK